MEVFVHSPGNEGPELIEIDETVTVRELLLEDDHDGRIWIEDIDEEVDLDVTLAEAGIRHQRHVHRGHCKSIDVVARFNGSNEHDFGPGTTIKTVEKWAFGPKAANLSPEEAAKHVLALPGADHFLAGTVHIGSLVTPGSCTVTLDILPRLRFEG